MHNEERPGASSVLEGVIAILTILVLGLDLRERWRKRKRKAETKA